MSRTFFALAVLALVLCLWPAGGVVAKARAQEQPVAFVNARIMPVSGPPIERGVLVAHQGKITLVGPADDATLARLPRDATRVDAAGKVIIPGLVDTHSHIGGVGGADSAGTIQPQVRVFDSLNVMDSGFRRAVAGGLTTLNIMPGSGHLLSGQTVYVKLRRTQTGDAAVHQIEDLMIRDGAGNPTGGIKMANGTNPMRDPPFAGTRGKAAAMVRERFIQAQEYKAKIERAAGDPEKLPARDLGLEALVEVLNGTRIVHHHTHRADDIMTVLRLQREFGFRVVLHHVSEAWKVADEIAAAAPEAPGKPGVIGCSAILVDSPGGKLEAVGLSYETAAALEKAGAQFSLHTDDWITDSRLFLRMAALSVRGGASREAALRSLTLSGAEQMDLQNRVGTLDAGKDADFVILSGDPFSVYTKVEQTWVEGVKVFDRADPKDALYATGGYGAGRDQEPYFCCFTNQ